MLGSTLADVRGFIFHTSRRRPMVYNTVDLYAVYAAIFVQNRVFFATPPAFDAPVTGVPVGISPSCLARKN